MTSQPPRTRSIAPLPWHSPALMILGALWLFVALAACANVPSAQRTRFGRLRACGSVEEAAQQALVPWSGILMNQYRSQDKLSWTFTPPPMAPCGSTTPTGSTAILAARSGMVFVARVARSMQCMYTRFTRDNHSPPPLPQYAAYQSILTLSIDCTESSSTID